MSAPPQPPNPNQVVPDALPPDVKIIECPASIAEYRSSDNSRWTNIIREPIRVKKGSEIMVSTNFIDQRGIDGDIIQFTSEGPEQDNSHTLLTQIYAVNDGFNNKTTSYDYMGRQQEALTLIDPGQNIAGAGYLAFMENVVGTGSALQVNVAIAAYCIRPQNINITNGGSGYINHDFFTMTSNPAGDNYTGYIITNDVGAVVKIVFTKAYSAHPLTFTTQAGMTFNNTNPLGEGLACTFANTTDGYYFSSLEGARTDAKRGTGYHRGDLLKISTDSVAGDIPEANQPLFMVNQIYSGPGGVNSEALFDQGYNYEKAPMLRWASVYDVNQNFSYGNNFGPRTFTQGNGNVITIQNKLSHHSTDTCISSATMILPREDEFAPGIFHKEFNELTDDTQGTQAQISLFSPIAYFTQDTGGIFIFGWWNEGLTIRVLNYNYTQNGNVVKGNVLNAYPPGSSLRIMFKDAGTPSDTQQALLDKDFNNIIGGAYVVKKSERDETSTTLYMSTYKIDYVGAMTAVVPYLDGGVYAPINATFNVQLVYSSCADGLGAPTTAPQIQITTNGTGNISSWSATAVAADKRGVGNRTGMIYTIAGYVNNDRFMCIKTDYTNGWIGSRGMTSLTNSGLTYNSGGARAIELFLIPINNYALPADTDQQKGDRIGFRYTTSAGTLGDLPATIAQQGISDTLDTNPTIGLTSYVSNGLYRQAGNGDSTSASFSSQTSELLNHDPATQLTCTDYARSLPNIVCAYGTDTGSDVVFPANPGTSTFRRADGVYVLKIHKVNWEAQNGSFSINTLPMYTTIELIPAIADAPQTNLIMQIETAGLESQDATYWYILIRTVDIQNNYLSYFPIAASSQAEMGGNAYFSDLDNTNPVNYEGTAIDNLNMIYTIPLYFNNQITFTWIDNTTANLNNGSICSTGPQNFFGMSDPNYSVLESINSNFIGYTDDSLKSSYDSGGYYFLTRFTGTLTNLTNTNTYQYNFTDSLWEKNIFNNYGIFLPFAQLPPDHYAWRDGKTDPWTQAALSYTISDSNFNSNTAYTNASNQFAYQPLYKQKTMTINKNFCVASDISGIWTRGCHSLIGAIDATSGEEYVGSDQTALLQNEFFFTAYGANNEVGPNGQYIKDYTRYYYYGGLEPGHCVAKCYINPDNDWLAGPLLAELPYDLNNSREFRFFYIFLRTAWTFLRVYDPLKSNAGLPDFSPLATLNQTADKIGNANDSDAKPTPISNQFSLDGQTMLNAGVTPLLLGYELGPAAGTVAPNTVKFNTQSYYPIFYMDERRKVLYPKAKASQYCGSQNLTLAFQSDISIFTFQFLHSPYSSPFVDGQGGANAIRIFYGNRKNGVYNHEALGGINVMNYARPDFPRGVFSYEEVIDPDLTVSYFPNGLDPLVSLSPIGNRFLNKIGFQDQDLGIQNGEILSTSTKSGYSYSAEEVNITSKMDEGETASIWTYATTFYGTTGTDIDSSDALLNEVPAPEIQAGLESNNVKVVPTIGGANYILSKYGPMIYYPYSLNTDTNSFGDKSIVRFDNASGSYGSIGGNFTSEAGRGLGLPNTIGSTFIVDEGTVPRQLNPDCNLYISYTIECGSSFIQASLLPSKLPNGYLVVLSSLQKQTPFYMAKVGFVPAVSVISKTFLTGDFILSNGELQFYVQEDMMLSEITTEIKDTNFNSPTVLGPNSCVIYKITNYNPVIDKPLLTIEQEQEKDYSLLAMVQEHLDYLEGHSKTSPLQDIEQSLQKMGLSMLQGAPNTAEIIEAMKNQIEFHDIPNLSKSQMAQFLQTPAGQDMQANAADLGVMHAEIGRIAQNREDMDILAATETPGAARLEEIERRNQTAIMNVARRSQSIRERIPQMFFTRALPSEHQLPPISSEQEVSVKNMGYEEFIKEAEKRYHMYTNYRESRIVGGRNPLTFEEFQHFHFGDIADVRNDEQRANVEKYDPDLLPNLERRKRSDEPEYYEEYEGGGAPAPSGRGIFINKEARIDKLEEPEAVRSLSQLRRNRPDSGYAAAYEAIPDYMRPRHNEPGYFENIRRFTDEIREGRAELTGAQIDILRNSGIRYDPPIGGQGRDIEVPHFLSPYDIPQLKNLGSLATKQFSSEKDKRKAERVIKGFNKKIQEAYATKSGRPTGNTMRIRKDLTKEIEAKLQASGVRYREEEKPSLNRVSEKAWLPADIPGKSMEGVQHVENTKRARVEEAANRIKHVKSVPRPRGEMLKQNIEDMRTVRAQREEDLKHVGMRQRLLQERVKGLGEAKVPKYKD